MGGAAAGAQGMEDDGELGFVGPQGAYPGQQVLRPLIACQRGHGLHLGEGEDRLFQLDHVPLYLLGAPSCGHPQVDDDQPAVGGGKKLGFQSAGNKEDQREAQGQGGQGGGGPSRPSRQRFLIRFQEPAVQPQGPGGRGTGQFGGGGRLQRGPGQDACGGRRFRRAGRGGSTPL